MIGALTVVGAVRDGDQFLVLSLVREPSLEVVFLGGRVVESSGDNRDELVRESERLVEGFRVGDHVIEHLPGRRRVGDTELM